MKHAVAILMLAIVALQAQGGDVAPERTVSETAQEARRPPGAPQYSDVCMRLFVQHDGREIEAGKAFHITCGLWSYVNNKDYIARIRELGWKFQGTLNGNTANAAHALKSRGENPAAVENPPFKRYWADPKNSEFRALYLEEAKRWIDNGAKSLQRDDPTFGDWQHGIQMSDDVLAEFHAWARREIEAYAGRPVPMSVNGIRKRPFEKAFDYFMTEMDLTRSVNDYLGLAREMKAYGRFMVLTGQHELTIPQFRLAIASAYATGNGIMLPWDQFNVAVLGNPKAERTFIDPRHLADLTGFVRACGTWLDDHEDAAVAGYSLKENRYGAQPPMDLAGGSGKLSALARAQPGKPEAPIVIHLIDAAGPASAILKLRTAAFFRGKPLEVRLLIPPAYDKAKHDKAEAGKDYSQLALESEVKTRIENDHLVLELPGLSPWGIVVVKPKCQ